MILFNLRPPSRLIVPPIKAVDGMFLGNGIPACSAAAMASKVEDSSSPGKWRCFSSPATDSTSDRKDTCDDVESRRREGGLDKACELAGPVLVVVKELRNESSSPSTRKSSSSSQFSISFSTGCRNFNRRGSMPGSRAGRDVTATVCRLSIFNFFSSSSSSSSLG